MQPEAFAPHILTAFFSASRRHFGLAPAPPPTVVSSPIACGQCCVPSPLSARSAPPWPSRCWLPSRTKSNLTPHPSVTQEKSKP